MPNSKYVGILRKKSSTPQKMGKLMKGIEKTRGKNRNAMIFNFFPMIFKWSFFSTPSGGRIKLFIQQEIKDLEKGKIRADDYRLDLKSISEL